MDASLEAALEEHIKLCDEKHSGGEGVEMYISEGFDQKGVGEVQSKLELGTWSERMEEMLDSVMASQSYGSVVRRVTDIKRWWDLTNAFLEQNSASLGDAVLKV